MATTFEPLVNGENDPAYAAHKAAGSPADSNYYKGWFNTIEQPVDPLLTGFAFILWLRVPTWLNGDRVDAFQMLTQKNLRAFDLPSDIELQTAGSQAGFSTEETNYANGITKSQGFTMTHKEYSGSPIRQAYTTWVTGIRDPKTGVATYPLISGLPYAAKNHTGELLYIVTRPDATNVGDASIIEFAAYFTNVMPTKAPITHFNFAAGTQDNPEIQQQFTGNMHVGATVMELAKSKLKEAVAFGHGDPTDVWQYENNMSLQPATTSA